MTRGLKNWVVEDGRSIEAAMADAKRDEDRGLASAQLEAFHQTFNFCMDCRQYTCTDCWNQAEGRCLSCAPMPGQLEAEVAAAHAAAQPIDVTNGIQPGMAWPTMDLTADEPAPAAWTSEPSTDVAAATPYIPTDLRPVELPDDDIEMMVGAADAAAERDATHDVAPEAEAVGAVAMGEVDRPDRAAVEAAAALAAAAGRHEPDTDRAAAAIGDLEPELAAAVAEPDEPEPVVAVEPEAEPIAAAQIEPDVAPEAEPVAAAEPEPIAEPAPAEPVTRTPTPGWAIVAPDAPRPDVPPAPAAWPPRSPVYQPPPAGPAAPAPTPGQPGQPSWPTMPPAAFSVPAAQAVWEESSLSVINRPGSGVQSCVSCGLPLSATARFCRRCGTRQG
ncbi:MAG: hypothetical protein ACHQ02_01390 [Candidatus Limnocylindrales bacterium]